MAIIVHELFRFVCYLILFTGSLDTYASAGGSISKLTHNVPSITEMGYRTSGVHRRSVLHENLYSGTQILGSGRADLEVSTAVRSGEAENLLEFRKGVTEDPQSAFLSWRDNNTSNYCNWTGVSCNNSTGQVSALNLSGLQLGGSISPSLGGLQFLSLLDLSDNNFVMEIPSNITSCSSLTDLVLRNNSLTGGIPELGNLQNLRYLDLSFNSLEGPIPTSLSKCSFLRKLYLSHNQLTGAIPKTLANCTSLNVTVLSTNRLRGQIPQELGNLSELVVLDLSVNNLTGRIPQSLASLKNLAYVSLSTNHLTGEIPRELGTLSELWFLYLGNNSLSGQIPEALSNCTRLFALDLSINILTGKIPRSLASLQHLSSLSLATNQLNGQIPSELGRLQNLTTLDLGSNSLTGEIPESLSNCTRLVNLDLSTNNLAGEIPQSLASLRNLAYVSLATNQLNGQIPPELGTLSELKFLYLHFNTLTGRIPVSLANCSHFVAIVLRQNLFVGEVPLQLGHLQNLTTLDLRSNSLTGEIPETLSNCTRLVNLDLSTNNLTGEIPQSLASLQYLVYFNVSFNQLTGRVPDVGPFRNFSQASYEGNPALCGRMLSRKCSSGRRRRLWNLIVPVVASFIAVLLAITAFWCLFIKKRPRLAKTVVVVPAIPPVTHFTHDFKDLSVGDIIAATNGFSDTNIIGMGARSTVYAGILPGGVTIAVKRLELADDDRATSELFRALQRLSKLKHPNLLKVHGLFSTTGLKALVLEYMANGSLHKQLYKSDKCHLTWAQRVDIALGVAEALVHLHHSGSKPVLHLDLKPSNIMLGEDMEPKVADYGIASFINHESHGDSMSVSSNLYGTIGYIPPEYGAMAGTSTKGDIYNFGVVLMELFTRKQPTHDMFGHELSLRSWVADAYPDRISHVIEKPLQQELMQNDQEAAIHLMVRLAVDCTQNAPKDRPTMIQVRDMLMEIKSFQPPSKTDPVKGSDKSS